MLRRGFSYLLDYITSTENFHIGDRKKKDMDPIYHNFYVVHRSRVKFEIIIFSVISDDTFFWNPNFSDRRVT